MDTDKLISYLEENNKGFLKMNNSSDMDVILYYTGFKSCIDAIKEYTDFNS